MAQKCKSAKQLAKYAWDYKGTIVCGTFWTLLGSLSDIIMPKLKGEIIDLLEQEDYLAIDDLLKFMGLFVLVSPSTS